MFGGYADLYAYGGDPSTRRRNGSDERNSGASVNDSDSSVYDCCTTSVLGGFRNWAVDRDDFILIGECEEIQGPSIVLAIPQSATVGVDTNGIILQLLSADYQGLGEGSMVPYEDAQSLLPDIQPDIHVLVNYFVLLDVQARGYVRPMCVAYVTAEKFKLAKMFLPLRHAITQACDAIKTQNWQKFCEEVKPMIEDLKYTQKVRENESTKKSATVIEKMQDENLDDALHDLESKLEIMQKLVEKRRKAMDDNIMAFLSHLKSHSNSPSYCHLEAMLKQFENETKNSYIHQPQILKVPLRQNFGSVLRPVTALSPVGFVRCAYELSKVLKYFQRHYETIAMTAKNDHLQGMCLHFGACLKDVCPCGAADANIGSSKKRMNPSEHKPELSDSDEGKYMDEDFFKLFQQLAKRYDPSVENQSSQINEGRQNESSVNQSRDQQLRFVFKRHDLLLNQLFDVVEQWQGTEIEETALSVLQSVFHKEELLYSVLRGRTIFVTASVEQRPLVEAFISVMSVIVPTSSRHPKSSELWTNREIQESDLSKFAIIGFCCTDEEFNVKVPKSILPKCSVFNMKKKKLAFPHYKGELLTGIAKSIKSLSPKGPLISVLLSFLADLQLKVQFFRLVIDARGEISTFRHFFNKGYSGKDIDLLWRLNGLLE